MPLLVFFRGTAGKNIQETGVGLATGAKITRLYDGRAWVEEPPGGGANFLLELTDRPPARASINPLLASTTLSW